MPFSWPSSDDITAALYIFSISAVNNITVPVFIPEYYAGIIMLSYYNVKYFDGKIMKFK